MVNYPEFCSAFQLHILDTKLFILNFSSQPLTSTSTLIRRLMLTHSELEKNRFVLIDRNCNVFRNVNRKRASTGRTFLWKSITKKECDNIRPCLVIHRADENRTNFSHLCSIDLSRKMQFTGSRLMFLFSSSFPWKPMTPFWLRKLTAQTTPCQGNSMKKDSLW